LRCRVLWACSWRWWPCFFLYLPGNFWFILFTSRRLVRECSACPQPTAWRANPWWLRATLWKHFRTTSLSMDRGFWVGEMAVPSTKLDLGSMGLFTSILTTWHPREISI
jgi:hypothetical protein